MIHVVAAIIWHPVQANTFLIAQRPAGKHLEYLWEFPGGKKEPRETAEQALRRELYEEINIQALKLSPYIRLNHEYPDRNILLDVWQVSAFEGAVSGKEGQEVRWVAIDELDNYCFPEADLPVLDAIKRNVRA